MGIFKCHFIPPVCCLIQPVEIAVSQPTFTKRQATWMETLSWALHQTVRHFKLTQLVLRKNNKRIVLIQILVKLYGEFTYKLGRSFYFLGEERKQSVKE